MDLVSWAADESRRRLEPVGARWAHSLGVVRRARDLAAMVDEADQHVLIAAAYLHDIGYAPELAVLEFHPLDGARWVERQGFPRLAGLVAHHTAARFEADARRLSEVLAGFPDEKSIVTDALTYCDLTTGPDGERIAVDVRLAEIARRYGPTSPVTNALEKASETLYAMVRRTERRLAASRLLAAIE